MTTTTEVRTTQPSMALLSEIEFRKLLDTRSGAVLFAVMGVWVIAGAVIGQVLLRKTELPLTPFEVAWIVPGLGAALLLPVVAILLVTGEYSHKTALTTFTLVPKRERVIAAKLIAATIIVLVVHAVQLALTMLAAWMANLTARDITLEIDWYLMFGFVLASWLNVLIGFALALLLHNPAASIILFFSPRLLATFIPLFGESVGKVWKWIDPAALDAVTSNFRHATNDEWWHACTVVVSWIVIPGVIGLIRSVRSDV